MHIGRDRLQPSLIIRLYAFNNVFHVILDFVDISGSSTLRKFSNASWRVDVGGLSYKAAAAFFSNQPREETYSSNTTGSPFSKQST